MTFAELLSPLLAETETSPNEKVMLWTLVLSAVGGFLTSIVTLIKGQMDRIQARKDKEAEAKSAAAAREQDRLDAECKARIILQEGSRREQRLAAKIDQNTDISKQAFEAANGHNEKIKTAVETVAQVAKVISQAPAREIHVTVDPPHLQ